MYHTLFSRHLFIFLLLFPLPALAIVNVEKAIIGPEQDGVSHVANVAVNGASGNTDKSSIKADLLSQWKHQKHTEFLMLRYNYGTSRGKVDSNKSFLHLRHRTDLNKQWAVEVLAQVGRDPFSRLSRRTLFGGGLRLTVLEKAGLAAVYLGLGGFYEIERLSITAATNDTNSRLWRSSNYLVLKRRFNEQFRLNSTTYYQPAFRNLSDYRLLEEISAYVKVMDNIDLKLSLDFTYDAQPPQAVKSIDLRYSTGLEVRF